MISMNLTVESVFKDAARLCQETGQDVGVRRKLSALALYAFCGSALYGLTMGLYHSPAQAVVSAVKVPALFLVTLAICLPTLHFVGLLFGSTIKLAHSLVVLLAGVALTSILLGAFAPISLFFLVSGSTYPFMLLMHVAIFGFCGAAGLFSIHRNFHTLRRQSDAPQALISDQVLKAWMLLYMFVGTQTAYVLSPFINRGPGLKFLNDQGGNFYSYLWAVIQEMMR
jgi:hypothetical protein